MFSILGYGSSRVTPQAQKDFRKLEAALVKVCAS